MAFVTGNFTHGGNGFLKKVLKEMLASGFWTIREDINQRGILGAASTVQSHTRAVSVNVTGLPLNTDVDLPICMFHGFQPRKNFTTPATNSVDFTYNPVRGTIQLKPGGIFDGGGGLANGNFTIDADYLLQRGWVVLQSTGVSTQETIYVGLQFDTIVNGSTENPVKTGIAVSVFTTWTVGVSDFEGVPITGRNDLADEVLCYVKPNHDGTYQMSITADRMIAFGETDGQAAWCFAGALARFRPLIEQAFVTAMMGCTSGAEVDDAGPVGKTDEPGAMGQQHGAAYLYDKSKFSSVADPVHLNANYWSFDRDSTAGVGMTPSQAVLNTPTPGFTPQYYFELHDVIVGRNIDQLNSQNAVIYGLVEGLKVPIVFDAKQDLELTFEGVTYRLWRVGSHARRYIAVAKI